MAMSDLDTVLKETLANASPHTRKVYGQNPLTGQEIVDMANSRGVMTPASTIGLNGRPHLSPIDLVGVDGTLFLGTDMGTAHFRNLKRNPAIAVMIVEGRTRQAILEGTASFLDMKSSLTAKVQEAQKKKTGWTTEAVAELRPEKIFTWKGK
jgi:general stress protein 26